MLNNIKIDCVTTANNFNVFFSTYVILQCDTSSIDRKYIRVPVTKCRTERDPFLSPPPCSPGKSQDPITRVSSIVMQITITNRRQGRGPL